MQPNSASQSEPRKPAYGKLFLKRKKKSWNCLYCILGTTSLDCYNNEEEKRLEVSIKLEKILGIRSSPEERNFDIITEEGDFKCKAESVAQRSDWIARLKDARTRFNLYQNLRLQINPKDIKFDETVKFEGGFGIVRKGEWAGITVAIKSFRVNVTQTDIVNEILNLGELRHPNCVEILGYYMESAKINVITNYVPHGSLFDNLYCKKDVQLDLFLRLRIAADVCKAMAYLHSRGIIHRDLKPPNILINSYSWEEGAINAKVADFGVSKKMDDYKATIGVGTMNYMAPEISTGKYDLKADVYSFGILLWELLSGDRPWREFRWDWEVKERVIKGARPPLDGFDKRYRILGEQFMFIIKGCWSETPEKRFQFTQILEAINGTIRCIQSEPSLNCIIELGGATKPANPIPTFSNAKSLSRSCSSSGSDSSSSFARNGINSPLQSPKGPAHLDDIGNGNENGLKANAKPQNPNGEPASPVAMNYRPPNQALADQIAKLLSEEVKQRRGSKEQLPFPPNAEVNNSSELAAQKSRPITPQNSPLILPNCKQQNGDRVKEKDEKEKDEVLVYHNKNPKGQVKIAFEDRPLQPENEAKKASKQPIRRRGSGFDLKKPKSATFRSSSPERLKSKAESNDCLQAKSPSVLPVIRKDSRNNISRISPSSPLLDSSKVTEIKPVEEGNLLKKSSKVEVNFKPSLIDSSVAENKATKVQPAEGSKLDRMKRVGRTSKFNVHKVEISSSAPLEHTPTPEKPSKPSLIPQSREIKPQTSESEKNINCDKDRPLSPEAKSPVIPPILIAGSLSSSSPLLGSSQFSPTSSSPTTPPSLPSPRSRSPSLPSPRSCSSPLSPSSKQKSNSSEHKSTKHEGKEQKKDENEDKKDKRKEDNEDKRDKRKEDKKEERREERKEEKYEEKKENKRYERKEERRFEKKERRVERRVIERTSECKSSPSLEKPLSSKFFSNNSSFSADLTADLTPNLGFGKSSMDHGSDSFASMKSEPLTMDNGDVVKRSMVERKEITDGGKKLVHIIEKKTMMRPDGSEYDIKTETTEMENTKIRQRSNSDAGNRKPNQNVDQLVSLKGAHYPAAYHTSSEELSNSIQQRLRDDKRKLERGLTYHASPPWKIAAENKLKLYNQKLKDQEKMKENEDHAKENIGLHGSETLSEAQTSQINPQNITLREGSSSSVSVSPLPLPLSPSSSSSSTLSPSPPPSPSSPSSPEKVKKMAEMWQLLPKTRKLSSTSPYCSFSKSLISPMAK